jgi:hypothetical protein
MRETNASPRADTKRPSQRTAPSPLMIICVEGAFENRHRHHQNAFGALVAVSASVLSLLAPAIAGKSPDESRWCRADAQPCGHRPPRSGSEQRSNAATRRTRIPSSDISRDGRRVSSPTRCIRRGTMRYTPTALGRGWRSSAQMPPQGVLSPTADTSCTATTSVGFASTKRGTKTVTRLLPRCAHDQTR